MAELDFSRTGAVALLEDAPTAPPQVNRPGLLGTLKSFFSSTPLKRFPVQTPSAEPWNAVALLNFFKGSTYLGFATGFLVKPDVVVTAAHNLQLTQPGAVGVYPGYDAKLNPSTSISGRAWSWHASRDVAVVVTAGSALDLLGMQPPTPGTVTLAGYAFPYPDQTPRMTFGAGVCKHDGQYLQYRIGVQPGDSGSPVFVAEQGGGAAVAIHSESRIVMTQGGLIGVGEATSPVLLHILADLEAQARAQIG